jgi:hypothetical protein
MRWSDWHGRRRYGLEKAAKLRSVEVALAVGVGDAEGVRKRVWLLLLQRRRRQCGRLRTFWRRRKCHRRRRLLFEVGVDGATASPLKLPCDVGEAAKQQQRHDDRKRDPTGGDGVTFAR